jgi:cytochrome b561
LLVVWVGVLGLLHDSWPRGTQSFWTNVHALSGLLLWAVVCARLWLRNRHPPPGLPPGVGEFSRRLSKPVDLLLYALMLVTPIIGIVIFIWHGRIFDFGLPYSGSIWVFGRTAQYFTPPKIFMATWPTPCSSSPAFMPLHLSTAI